MPAAAIAAAAWSWVEKMLHDAQRTSAPSAVSVSISTAVWIVMCSEPAIRAPFSGLVCAVFLAQRHQARHFGLGDVQFLAAVLGQRDILDDVVLGHTRLLLKHVVVAVQLAPHPHLGNR